MEKEELLKRIDEVISNDEKMKEIAEKLIAPFVKKKERDCKVSAGCFGICTVNTHHKFENNAQASDFISWTIIDEKVRDIAYDLGVPSDEDWKDDSIIKHYITAYNAPTICASKWRISGAIFCLDKNFLDVVKSKISNDDLIFWCKYTKP